MSLSSSCPPSCRSVFLFPAHQGTEADAGRKSFPEMTHTRGKYRWYTVLLCWQPFHAHWSPYSTCRSQAFTGLVGTLLSGYTVGNGHKIMWNLCSLSWPKQMRNTHGIFIKFFLAIHSKIQKAKSYSNSQEDMHISSQSQAPVTLLHCNKTFNLQFPQMNPGSWGNLNVLWSNLAFWEEPQSSF